MMLKRNIIILLFFQIFLSCNSQNQKYNSENINAFYSDMYKVKQNAKDNYKIDSLFSHYPKEFSLDSISSHMFVISYQKISKNNTKNEYSCFVLKDKQPEKIDSSIYSKFTAFNIGFYGEEYCRTIDTNALKNGLNPIPDLEELLYSQKGRTIKFQKILFYEAKSGDFWKIKNDSERPKCLGKWKNGYSRGIGVYKDSTGWKKMYWVMYW
jgi:hypothetical protein